MEPSRTIACEHRDKKVSKSMDDGNGCDRISNLPREILGEIVSYLTMKELLRTSVLSKRWRYVWTSVSDIEIYDVVHRRKDGRIIGNINRFMDIVDRVLLFDNHDASVLNWVFLAWVGSGIDYSRLHSWVRAAIKKNVKGLSLWFYSTEGFEVPVSLFSSQKLTRLILHLQGFVIKILPTISLVNLRSLALRDIEFNDGILITKLVSSCLVLEELHLDSCKLINVQKFSIVSPTLKVLTIDQLIWSPLPLEEINLATPRLTSFNYCGDLEKDYAIEGLDTVVDASIGIWRGDITGGQTPTAIRLLARLCSVEKLTICHSIFEILTSEPVWSILLPVYKNLKELNITAGMSNTDIKVITDFLPKSPKLQVLYVRFPSEDKTGEENWMYQNFPSCLLSKNLKVVRIANFSASNNELEFVRCLLEGVSTLEKMEITARFENSMDMAQVSQKLSKFRRASIGCVVSLS